MSQIQTDFALSSSVVTERALTKAFENVMNAREDLRVSLVNALQHGGSIQVKVQHPSLLSRLRGEGVDFNEQDILQNRGFQKLRDYLGRHDIKIESLFIPKTLSGVLHTCRLQVKRGASA